METGAYWAHPGVFDTLPHSQSTKFCDSSFCLWFLAFQAFHGIVSKDDLLGMRACTYC